MMRPLLTPEGTPLVVAFDTSTQSTALSASTTLIRLASTTGCWIKIAANPTASVAAGSIYIPANTPVFMGGIFNGLKVAAIKDTTAGNLSITQGLQF